MYMNLYIYIYLFTQICFFTQKLCTKRCTDLTISSIVQSTLSNLFAVWSDLIQCDRESHVICTVSICLAITFYPTGYACANPKSRWARGPQPCSQGADGDFGHTPLKLRPYSLALQTDTKAWTNPWPWNSGRTSLLAFWYSKRFLMAHQFHHIFFVEASGAKHQHAIATTIATTAPRSHWFHGAPVSEFGTIYWFSRIARNPFIGNSINPQALEKDIYLVTKPPCAEKNLASLSQYLTVHYGAMVRKIQQIWITTVPGASGRGRSTSDAAFATCGLQITSGVETIRCPF